MKLLFTFLIVGLISTTPLFAQEPSNGTMELNKFLARNIKYPTLARRNDIQGLVVIQVSFDEGGNPINTTILAGNESLVEEVMSTFSELQENWKADFLGDRKLNDTYLLSFQFKLAGNKQVSNPIKTLTIPEDANGPNLTSAIESNPYDSKLYEQRAATYESLGLTVLAEKDRMLAGYFKEKMLAQLVIVGYPSDHKSISTID